ncbi:MAG: BamA/TamA family outer membrane protein [Flavobacteriales bacterium]
MDKNKIITNSDKVNKDKLSSVIRQRPNRKIFSVVKFHLLLHNSMDSAKVAHREVKKLVRKNKKIKRKNKRIRKKNIRIDRRNEKIKRKNTTRKPDKQRELRREKDSIPYLTSETFDSFGEKILYSIGEAPVVLSERATHETAEQLHIYLIRKGFFNNTVTDSIRYIDKKFFGLKKKRAEVFYFVNVSDPYKIKDIEIKSKDTALLADVNKIMGKSKLKTGDVFDIDRLDDERERITSYLLNHGYYRFNKNYVRFYVDSSVYTNGVSVVIQLDLYKEKVPKTDSVAEYPHSVFLVKEIKIKYIQDKKNINITNFSFKNVDFSVQGNNDINANLFYSSLFLNEGDIYSKEKQQQTFRKLTSLGVFGSVNIITETDTVGGAKNLIMNIIVEGAKRQYTRTEGNGTTSGSNFGIEGSFEYNHRNIFRGAEILHIGVSGALESQPLFLNDNTSDISNVPIDIQSFTNISTSFNTIEFGPEMSLTFPSLLFIPTNKYKNVSNTKTVLSLSLNYQRRLDRSKLDFERGIQEVAYGYSWTVKNKYSHILEPIVFSAVEVTKSEAFQDRINSLNDKLLAASFQNHIISASRYRFIYNNPTIAPSKRFTFYYDGAIESAGNILNTFYKLTNQTRDPITESYKIAGIQFAQYLKTHHDARVYNRINDKSSLVFRLSGGVGVPLENLSAALPFEKSFFAGGTDKMRAWKARSLGPGSFRDSALVFDKIGEVLIESNLEYRFDLLGFLDGALFVDAGNIWLMNEDSLRPGSQFKVDRFIKQIAIGAGFGIRVDLSFFLVRLDVAWPLKNPTLVEGERWFFQDKTEYNSWKNTLQNSNNVPNLYTPQINIGIGYPF